MTEKRWATRRADFCLDRWIESDQPSRDLQASVVGHLLDLLDDPRAGWLVPVPGAAVEMYVGDVPGTSVCVLLVLLEDSTIDRREIVFWSIDTL